jgi:hypothetical protein
MIKWLLFLPVEAMELEIENAVAWSEAIFGRCDLGDKRLTGRLVKISSQLSKSQGASLSKSCEGKSALIEGSYRFIRNERVSAMQIAEGGYTATALLAQTIPVLLAIEDSTSLAYQHEVSKELGYTSNSANTKTQGYLVHSTMLMDAQKEKTIGLIAQERWCRDKASYGKHHQRNKIQYKDKESYKWEKNTHFMENCLGEKIKDVISVCDREADVYEYIQYKLEHNQRFIVRGKHNRKLANTSVKLLEDLSNLKPIGSYAIEIAQKSKRKKRVVELEIMAKQVTFLPAERSSKALAIDLRPITLNVVIVREKNPLDTEEILEWILLTTEPITSFDEIRQITRYYELRWRIEDFHKAWKSGVGAERQRMQSPNNLEKMVVILSFLAVRLLQLKEYLEPSSLALEEDAVCTPCNELLTEIEWKVLWKTVEKKELPSKTPTAEWAYQAIAKLGGWSNSKRTGKASWATLWDGWFRLTERVEGFLLAKSLGVA